MKRIAPLLLTLFLLASCATSQQYACMKQRPTEYDVFPVMINILCYTNGLDANKVYSCITENDKMVMQIDDKPTITASTRFLNEFKDSDLLTCAIAHELAHYKLNHIWKHKGVVLGTSIVFGVANYFVPGIAYADYVVNPTVSMAFGRSQELDADIEAVNFCKNAGVSYAPQRYIALMNHLNEIAPNEKGISIIWADHPNVSDRIGAIKKAYGIP